jgi:parvulin-like peptidyl-prolyl isomerase
MEIKSIVYGKVFPVTSGLSFPSFFMDATPSRRTIYCGCRWYPSEADLAYALNISHRREDLSSAGSLDVSSYMEKLINDTLIFDEARRMGLDRLPEVQKKMEAYILRESVMKLHAEEVMQKISPVTEDDIIAEYRKNYFHFGIIEMKSEDDAKAVQEKLAKGEDFSELARTHSIHSSKEIGGEVVYLCNSLAESMRDALSKLKTDEVSDSINIGDKYYLVKLLGTKETDEAFGGIKEGIAESLRKQRQKELEENYLKTLREKATITMNEELLSRIDLAGGEEEIEKWTNDTTPLAEVNTAMITVRDFVTSIPLMKRGSLKTLEDKKGILNSLIDVKVVDQAALSRHYEMKGLSDEAERYENHLLKNAFMNRIVFSEIAVTEEKLRDYYGRNQKRYAMPVVYRLRQIQVKTMEEAEDAMNNLKNGADFLWLAKRKLPSSISEDMIDMGWMAKNDLPEPLRESIDSMKPRDVSPVFKNNGLYVIVQLLDKTEEEIKDFESVRKEVEKAYFEEQVNDLLAQNIMKLKQDAEIIIYDDAVKAVERKVLR